MPPEPTGSRATPTTVARNLPDAFGGAGDLTPGGPPRSGADARARGRAAPSIAPAPLFPKQLHDAETVAAERSSFASLLDGEGDSRKSMSVGTETVAADPPRRIPPRSARDAPARRGWLVGVVATGMLAMGLLGVLGLVAAASAWWMWPDDDVALDPTPIHQVAAGPGLMDDDEMVEMLSQAPLPPPDGLRVTFNSVPLGADVYIDGRRVGQTPLIGVKLNEGAHEVILLSDFERVTRTIDVGERKPMRFVWRGGERWEEHGKR